MKLEFAEWLKNELTIRGLGVREFARLAGVPSGSISRVLNQTRSAGPRLCKSIAKALDIPEDIVFNQAGLLQQSPETANTAISIYHSAKRLPLDKQKEILALIRESYTKEYSET